MQNLGYYQLQAQPGLWTLRLAPGTVRYSAVRCRVE